MILYNPLIAMTGFILALVIHELGHGFALYYYFGTWPEMGFEKWKFRVGTVQTYWKLTNQERFIVYFAGFMPGLMVMAFMFSGVLSGILMLLYLVLSAKDLILMWEIIKKIA